MTHQPPAPAALLPIGHQAVWRYFREAAAAGSLAHAYILSGPAGVGKSTLALSLAAELLGATPEAVLAHPDCSVVSRLIDPKNEVLRQEITVAQARAAREWLSRRPWGAGGYHILIIDEADRLNAEATAALLKVMEEPPPQSLIFLLVAEAAALLPTIRSRASVCWCGPVPASELVAGLVARGYQEPEAQAASAQAFGRPGWAIRYLTDLDWRTAREGERTRWGRLLGSPWYVKVEEINQLLSNRDGGGERERALFAIHCWIGAWRGVLAAAGGETSPGEHPSGTEVYSLLDIARYLDALHQAIGLIAQNVNPRLVLENAVLDW